MSTPGTRACVSKCAQAVWRHVVYMMKAAAAKLAGLITIIFILCLPEFFPSSPVLQIQLFCLPFDPCDPKSERSPNDGNTYEPYVNASAVKTLCEAEQPNRTSGDETFTGWFTCYTKSDLWNLHDNVSDSGVDVELVMTLQKNLLLENVTVDGHFNYSGLHVTAPHNITQFRCINQPGRNDRRAATKQKTKLSSEKPNTNSGTFISMDSIPVCQENRSRYLLHYLGVNISRPHSKTERWWDVGTTVWSVLVLFVFVLVVFSVAHQVSAMRSCWQKRSHPAPVTTRLPLAFSKRRTKSLGDLPDVSISLCSLEDKELFLDETLMDHSKEKFLCANKETYKRGLSPIHEVSMTDIILDDEELERRPDGVLIDEWTKGSQDFTLQSTAITRSKSLTSLPN